MLRVGHVVEISTIFASLCGVCCLLRLALVRGLGYFSNICSNDLLITSPHVRKKALKMSVPEIRPSHEVIADGVGALATPIEFTFKGRRFRIHTVLSRWCEAGGWWNRVSDGIYRPDDGARALWTVEAAPIGAVTTFEIERDEATGQWLIRSV